MTNYTIVKSRSTAMPIAHPKLKRQNKTDRPVACNQVPAARGRGQGTEMLAELGGLPP